MLKIYYFWTVYNCPKCTKNWIMYKKIKGILFDFDGVIAESEQIWFGTALVTLKKNGNEVWQKHQTEIYDRNYFRTLIPKS